MKSKAKVYKILKNIKNDDKKQISIIELNNKSENRELIGKLPSAIIDEMYKKQSQIQNDVNDSFSTMDEDLKN